MPVPIRGCSSAWQSTCMACRGSGVQIPSAPRERLGRSFAGLAGAKQVARGGPAEARTTQPFGMRLSPGTRPSAPTVNQVALSERACLESGAAARWSEMPTPVLGLLLSSRRSPTGTTSAVAFNRDHQEPKQRPKRHIGDSRKDQAPAASGRRRDVGDTNADVPLHRIKDPTQGGQHEACCSYRARRCPEHLRM